MLLKDYPSLKPSFTDEKQGSVSSGTPPTLVLPPRGFDRTTRVPGDWHDAPWILGRLAAGKQAKVKTVPQWSCRLSADLVSAATGGQWPQARIAGARKWEVDDRCKLCLKAQGTLKHRLNCHITTPAEGWPKQSKGASCFRDNLNQAARDTLDTKGLAIIRARIPDPPPDEDVVWLRWFDDHVDEAELTWYIDGSLLDGPRAWTGRTGAGFAAVLPSGKLEAYGYGTPPGWISTIPGVEAWALSVVIMNTVTRKAVVTDCMSNVHILRGGRTAALDASRPLARVWSPIFNGTCDDTLDGSWLVWMPAHTSRAAIGTALDSCGKAITAISHRANFLVDGLAKFAAALNQLPRYLTTLTRSAEAAIEHAAAMVGVAGHTANNWPTQRSNDDGSTTEVIMRDSAPTSWVTRKAERAKAKAATVSREKRAADRRAYDDATRSKCRRDTASAEETDRQRRVAIARGLITAATADYQSQADPQAAPTVRVGPECTTGRTVVHDGETIDSRVTDGDAVGTCHVSPDSGPAATSSAITPGFDEACNHQHRRHGGNGDLDILENWYRVDACAAPIHRPGAVDNELLDSPPTGHPSGDDEACAANSACGLDVDLQWQPSPGTCDLDDKSDDDGDGESALFWSDFARLDPIDQNSQDLPHVDGPSTPDDVLDALFDDDRIANGPKCNVHEPSLTPERATERKRARPADDACGELPPTSEMPRHVTRKYLFMNETDRILNEKQTLCAALKEDGLILNVMETHPADGMVGGSAESNVQKNKKETSPSVAISSSSSTTKRCSSGTEFCEEVALPQALVHASEDAGSGDGADTAKRRKVEVIEEIGDVETKTITSSSLALEILNEAVDGINEIGVILDKVPFTGDGNNELDNCIAADSGKNDAGADDVPIQGTVELLDGINEACSAADEEPKHLGADMGNDMSNDMSEADSILNDKQTLCAAETVCDINEKETILGKQPVADEGNNEPDKFGVNEHVHLDADEPRMGVDEIVEDQNPSRKRAASSARMIGGDEERAPAKRGKWATDHEAVFTDDPTVDFTGPDVLHAKSHCQTIIDPMALQSRAQCLSLKKPLGDDISLEDDERALKNRRTDDYVTELIHEPGVDIPIMPAELVAAPSLTSRHRSDLQRRGKTYVRDAEKTRANNAKQNARRARERKCVREAERIASLPIKLTRRLTRKTKPAELPLGSCAGRLHDAVADFWTARLARTNSVAYPAFAAHEQPFTALAKAAWERWWQVPDDDLTCNGEGRPERGLEWCLKAASAKVEASGKNIWATVTGPFTAVAVSAARLGWKYLGGLRYRTDVGEAVDLTLDSPQAVKLRVRRAVARWRARRIDEQLPQLALLGRPPVLAGVRAAAKAPSASDPFSKVWQPGCVSHLRSAVANGQWPQARLKSARFTDDPLCQLCRAHVGTLAHRRECVITRSARGNIAMPPYLRSTFDLLSSEQQKLLLTRGLIAPVDLSAHPPAQEDSFCWTVEPEGGLLMPGCTIYLDGSFRDGPTEELGRAGWGFIAFDEQGRLHAAAFGAPPPWIRSIHGAEMWALFAALRCALPGSSLRSDRKAVVDTYNGGRATATAAADEHARLWCMIFAACDDGPLPELVWMPAHTSAADVGRARLSNGCALTTRDRSANDAADHLAKRGAETHRVDKLVRREAKLRDRLAEWAARSLAVTTFAANNARTEDGKATLRDSAGLSKVARGKARAALGKAAPAPVCTDGTDPPELAQVDATPPPPCTVRNEGGGRRSRIQGDSSSECEELILEKVGRPPSSAARLDARRRRADAAEEAASIRVIAAAARRANPERVVQHCPGRAEATRTLVSTAHASSRARSYPQAGSIDDFAAVTDCAKPLAEHSRCGPRRPCDQLRPARAGAQSAALEKQRTAASIARLLA